MSAIPRRRKRKREDDTGYPRPWPEPRVTYGHWLRERPLSRELPPTRLLVLSYKLVLFAGAVAMVILILWALADG